MVGKVSLREIVERGFRVWEDTIKRLGYPIDYSLKIDEVEYKAEFSEEAMSLIGAERVIGELVLNALKATFGVRDVLQISRGDFGREIPAGQTPTIEVYLGVDNGNYIIRVSDNGPGISPENQKRIWERGFSTLGTRGIGLPAMRKELEDYHGRIELESALGKGTTFSIYFPRNEPAL